MKANERFYQLVSAWLANYVARYRFSFEELSVSPEGVVHCVLDNATVAQWKNLLWQAWIYAMDNGEVTPKTLVNIAKDVYPTLVGGNYSDTSNVSQCINEVVAMVNGAVYQHMATE